MGQVANRTEIGVKLELLPQRDVDARKPPAHRGCDWTLQGYPCALDRFERFLGNVFSIFLEGVGTHRKLLPLELQAGRFKNSDGRLADFRSDSITGDEGYFVTHDCLSVRCAQLCAVPKKGYYTRRLPASSPR